MEDVSVRWHRPLGLLVPDVITGNECIVLKAVCCPLFPRAGPVWDCLSSSTHSSHYVPCSVLRAAVNICAQASSAAAEFSQKGVVNNIPSQSLPSLWEYPGVSASFSHSSQGNQAKRGPFDVTYIPLLFTGVGGFQIRISDLHMGCPFTTF